MPDVAGAASGAPHLTRAAAGVNPAETDRQPHHHYGRQEQNYGDRRACKQNLFTHVAPNRKGQREWGHKDLEWSHGGHKYTPFGGGRRRV
jgi:hypothetical protein